MIIQPIYSELSFSLLFARYTNVNQVIMDNNGLRLLLQQWFMELRMMRNAIKFRSRVEENFSLNCQRFVQILNACQTTKIYERDYQR
jgi:hypothetical protein